MSGKLSFPCRGTPVCRGIPFARHCNKGTKKTLKVQYSIINSQCSVLKNLTSRFENLSTLKNIILCFLRYKCPYMSASWEFQMLFLDPWSVATSLSSFHKSRWKFRWQKPASVIYQVYHSTASYCLSHCPRNTIESS